MKVGLFIPCYIDAFFPEVSIATLVLLERLGCSVEYPLEQTCCGQPIVDIWGHPQFPLPTGQTTPSSVRLTIMTLACGK